MVIAQPYLPRTSLSATEPHQWTAEAKPLQLAVLAKTLAVALSAQHGVSKTHFTIFPEYGIPGLDGIEQVETAIRADNWPNGTIVIGGTDALTQAQYGQLLQGDGTHVDAARNGADRVAPNQWVNCAITWVKGLNGSLERWIQPKLYPAWLEMDISDQHMFRGSSLYLFKGRLENNASYRFGTLVCFDWIATVGTQTPCQWILAEMQQQAGENQLSLSWLFIIQHNPRPSHAAFLNRVGAFFDQTQFPSATRERACLVFANTAGRAVPGRTREFGACSVILSPHSIFAQPLCVPTFSRGGPRFRDGSNLLHDYKDVFFRERGACIHSFAQINPGSLIPGAAGRTFAVENAYVCPISGPPEPRAPAADVPASIKWLNDELDEVQSLSASYRAAPLSSQVDIAHQQNTAALRGISSQSTTQAISLAAQESKTQNADDWDATESEALEHLVHTLDIIGVGFAPPTVGTVPAHAAVPIQNKIVDILAIRGVSHENCIAHSMKFLTNPQRQVILVSRDPDNTPWVKRFGSFLRPDTPQLGEERNITDPASGSLHIGYQNLLGIFRCSATPAALEGGISAEFAA
ncbi:MAG TPA: hypothetical protein VNE63_16410 [Candidatus Acidoferrales bacterium]|nr:hypothetical protein [Candidatus Acidoferrales bacterium]